MTITTKESKTPFGTRVEKKLDPHHVSVVYKNDKKPATAKTPSSPSRRRLLQQIVFLATLGLIR